MPCPIENAITWILRFISALHTSSARNGTEFRLLSHCQKLGMLLYGFSIELSRSNNRVIFGVNYRHDHLRKAVRPPCDLC